MTPGQRYSIKRNNFLRKTREYFEFLTSEYRFEDPRYSYSEQPNGTIITDKFEFENKHNHQILIISNAYHPVDYGFEITLLDAGTGKKELLHMVLKEKQDVEQNYIRHIAGLLKTEMAQRLGKPDS